MPDQRRPFSLKCRHPKDHPLGGWFWSNGFNLYHWGDKVQPTMCEDGQWGYFKTTEEALAYGEKHGLIEKVVAR
jgi:hypothetical protein